MKKLVSHGLRSLKGDVAASLTFVGQHSAVLHFKWDAKWPLRGMEPANSRRASEIWKSTCFEAFIKNESGPDYWEINVSPNGAWNVYRFDGYRTPSPPREADKWQLKEFEVTPGELKANFDCDWSGQSRFNIGLSCVLEMENGEKSYWSLVHLKANPDFHDENAYILKGGLK